jgi:hypothetical protein
VHLPESLLHRVVLPVLGQPLDRRDFGAVGLDGKDGATLDRLAVEIDDAGAALAGVAADVGAGQPEVLPQEMDEQQSRLDLRRVRDPVDRQPNGQPGWCRHGLRHRHPLSFASFVSIATRPRCRADRRRSLVAQPGIAHPGLVAGGGRG